MKSLPPSRREKLRELWRNAQLKYRTKKKNLRRIVNLTPESSFNEEVEVHLDPQAAHCSTPDHPVSAQNQERPPPPLPPEPESQSPLPPPQSSPSDSPSPWMVEINNLKSQLKKQRNQNKVLMRRVHVEQRKATKYRKQCLRQMKKIVKPATVTKSPKNKKSEKAQKVESFLLLEENSILLPGKKDVVGRKVKKQRRVLTKPLTDLHKAYMQTCDRKHRMSYRQFTRYRPFYITEAKPKDRR